MSFPAAEGVRLTWDQLPAPLVAEIEDRLGSPVVDAWSQAGGFSPGLASRLRTAAGERVFVKAVSGAQNPESPAIHRREVTIAAALPAAAPVPRLRWSLDDGDWVVLAFDDIDGRQPETPWRADELARVLALIAEIASTLTPSPIDVEPAATRLAPLFSGWRALAADEPQRARLEPEWAARVEELAELEAGWPDAVTGTTLVHCDVRADNVLLTADGAYLVDWPWATLGAAWVDLAAFLPSVAMQSGGDPEEIWRAHPVSRGVDDDALDAFLAALAGFFTNASLQPAAPGLPTLRHFQAAQGVTARAWLAQRRGWS
jgi:aminoglycoside phosphotransferase (APT) family kinase protein